MIEGLIISWLFAGISSVCILIAIELIEFGEIEGLIVPILFIALVVGWVGLWMLLILGISNTIKNYKKIIYWIKNRIVERKRKKFEKWLLTPEGKKEKYKFLFKDA